MSFGLYALQDKKEEESIAMYLDIYCLELIAKSNHPVKFLPCRKSTEVVGYNLGKILSKWSIVKLSGQNVTNQPPGDTRTTTER